MGPLKGPGDKGREPLAVGLEGMVLMAAEALQMFDALGLGFPKADYIGGGGGPFISSCIAFPHSLK